MPDPPGKFGGFLNGLGLLGGSSFEDVEGLVSKGILAKRSCKVGPLLGPGSYPPNLGLEVVVVVVASSELGLGENLFSLFLNRPPTPPGGLVVAKRLGLDLNSSVGSSLEEFSVVVVVSSRSAVVAPFKPIFWPSLCLKRSAKDLGLKVVVVLVGIGGKVLILNRLNLVVVGGSRVTGSSSAFSSLSFN